MVRSELETSAPHLLPAGVAYIGLIAADTQSSQVSTQEPHSGVRDVAPPGGTCYGYSTVKSPKQQALKMLVPHSALHGCCENRGIMAHSSLTQTTVLKGSFH